MDVYKHTVTRISVLLSSFCFSTAVEEMTKQGIIEFKDVAVRDEYVNDLALFCSDFDELRGYLDLKSDVEKKAVDDLEIAYMSAKKKKIHFLRKIWIFYKTGDATYGKLIYALFRTNNKPDAESVCRYIKDNLKGN